MKIKADPGTKRAADAIAVAKAQAARKKYYEIKERLLKFEENNYTQLVLIKSMDADWWKMFSHSAIFYKYMIGERLKLTVNLLPDTDYHVKSKEGFVAIKDLVSFENKLKESKIYRLKTTSDTIIFDLGERVSEQDYQQMLREDMMRLEMANKLIVPEEHMVELNGKVRDLHEMIYTTVRKMDGVARETFANEIERTVAALQRKILRVSRGTADIDDCLADAFDATEELYGYVTNLITLKLLAPKKIYDLTVAIVALEKQIKREMHKRVLVQAEINIKNEAKNNMVRRGKSEISTKEKK